MSHFVTPLPFGAAAGLLSVNLLIGFALHVRAKQHFPAGPRNRKEFAAYIVVMSLFGILVLLWIVAKAIVKSEE